MKIPTLPAALLALLLSLTACGGSNDDAEMADTDSSGEPTSSAVEATPSEAPDYTTAQTNLLNKSSVNWTGEPETLFSTADNVCSAYEPNRSLSSATDSILNQTTTKQRPVAKRFAIDIVKFYCLEWSERGNGNHPDYWRNLDRYIRYVNNTGYGSYIYPRDVITDSAEFCNAAESGASYGDIAQRIRDDYFGSEQRVKDYIGHGFEFMCPKLTVEYVAPPPPAAATDFYGGTYRVALIGKRNIQPGTYAANTQGDGCYWERNDANGNIVDNYYGNGLRVQVTIYASDYSFNSNNCGHWKKVG